MALNFEDTGVLQRWTYEWKDAVAYMDEIGNYQITGALLPTPTSSRTTAVDSFTWHHMAPMVGFRISRNGSTITITSIPETHYSQDYPYYEYSPTLTFYYQNASGGLVAIGSFGTEAEYNGKSYSVTASGINQTAIYVNCTAPECYVHVGEHFLGYLKLHSHITAPSAPEIESTTGKTIKVNNGEDGLYCTTNSDGWYDTPHTFTGLSQGTSYRFKCRKYCPDCPEGKIYESGEISGKTWSISGSLLNSGAKSMVFRAIHVAGTGGNASNHTITYKLFTSKDASGTPVDTKTADNRIPVTFTGLTPGKTYYCYAYTTNLGGGDNNCWISATTKTQTTIQGSSGDVSATTLRVSVSWNAGGATSVVCTVTCDNVSRNISSSGGYVGFTGLTPGVNYPVSWKVVSTYTYSYKYTIINANGVEEEKTGTITDTIESTDGSTFTTKKTQILEPINITSKIIQFKSSSNYSSDSMEQKVSSNDYWDSVNQNAYFIYNNLTHNKSYTIYARITGCYAFTTSGTQTNNNDSEVSRTVSTLLLSLNGSISEEHQHSLITLWQAYVDGIARDSDAIDGELFEFTYTDTLAIKNNPPYQSAEVIEGGNGNTIGDYQSDKKIYSNDLTWYYCEYVITASITDGYNIVAAAVTAHTIFPAAWIYSGGQWRRYMGHVYHNGEYVPAPVFVYKNNKYTEPNGE